MNRSRMLISGGEFKKIAFDRYVKLGWVFVDLYTIACTPILHGFVVQLQHAFCLSNGSRVRFPEASGFCLRLQCCFAPAMCAASACRLPRRHLFYRGHRHPFARLSNILVTTFNLYCANCVTNAAIHTMCAGRIAREGPARRRACVCSTTLSTGM